MNKLKHLVSGLALLSCAMTATTALAYTADIPEEVEDKGRATIGLAVGTGPDYEGSDDYETTVAPFGRYSWANGRYLMLAGTANAEKAARLKLNLMTNKTNWRLGPILQYRLKRDDVDNRQVDNMKEVDAATELGGFIGYNTGKLALRGTFVADVSDEHNGSVGYLNADYHFPVTDRFALNVGAHMTWASDGYMETYFGVDRRNRGTSNLPNYKASSGIKDTGASVVATYMFNQNWGLLGLVNYTRMLNDAEDSPLVNDEGDENQVKAFLAVTYSW